MPPLLLSSVTPDRRYSGVTSKAAHMSNILSEPGFVFFFRHSLIVVVAIPVLIDNSFCNIPFCPNNSKIR